MGLKPSGSDIDRIMINRAKINLKHFKIKDYNLKQLDCLTINRKIKYLVADLPYSRNTKKIELDRFYREFVEMLERVLINSAVISFPNTRYSVNTPDE